MSNVVFAIPYELGAWSVARKKQSGISQTKHAILEAGGRKDFAAYDAPGKTHDRCAHLGGVNLYSSHISC